ncbi:hypothetical protein EVAR_37686_1 [Eumeta japonica]|uniref:Uncharacterized protein n=1 Tax=Eumeta variegata TaxID=151549 RepID=A0A4C1XV00_EUMVA|nr:hypothetical protein EVAR_37686_1 [Eumeta japonica]
MSSPELTHQRPYPVMYCLQAWLLVDIARVPRPPAAPSPGQRSRSRRQTELSTLTAFVAPFRLYIGGLRVFPNGVMAAAGRGYNCPASQFVCT